MTKHIILMNTKGGVGKTCICKQLSRELYRLGYSVQAVDYDPQQHFAKFANVNASLFTDIEPDFCIIDTQGVWAGSSKEIIEGINPNDDCMIIVPFTPVEDDYTEALRMRDRFKVAGILNKALFLPNACYRDNDKDVAYYSGLLSDTVYVTKAVFTRRKAFAKEPNARVIFEVSRFIQMEILK